MNNVKIDETHASTGHWPIVFDPLVNMWLRPLPSASPPEQAIGLHDDYSDRKRRLYRLSPWSTKVSYKGQAMVNTSNGHYVRLTFEPCERNVAVCGGYERRAAYPAAPRSQINPNGQLI